MVRRRLRDLLRRPTAENLRRRAAEAVGRVRTQAWTVGQAAVSATVGWVVAGWTLHHVAPFFAAVAGIISLSAGQENRLRRIVELSIGVSIGVGIGDLVVSQIGRGVWQVWFVASIAMLLAILVNAGTLSVTQAGIQSTFVVAYPAPNGGYSGRWLDALVGGAVAVLIVYLFPADPRPPMRRSSSRLVEAVAGSLQRAAQAARAGDADGVAAALETLRSTQRLLDGWRSSIAGGAEIVRLSRWRSRHRALVETHRAACERLDHAVRNLRVAERRLLAATEDAEAGLEPVVPEDLLQRVEDLARALHTVPALLVDPHGEGGRRARVALTTLAARLDPDELQAESMSALVVVAQLRSAVIDLLQITGVTFDEARSLVR